MVNLGGLGWRWTTVSSISIVSSKSTVLQTGNDSPPFLPINKTSSDKPDTVLLLIQRPPSYLRFSDLKEGRGKV